MSRAVPCGRANGADKHAIAAAARERSVGLCPMAAYRLSTAARPPEIVLGFGTLTDQPISRGIAWIGDLLSH